MCIVSMISDGWYRPAPTAPPYYEPHIPNSPWPGVLPKKPIEPPNVKPLELWPAKQVLDFAAIIRRLDDIDKKLGLRDCKDEQKEKFLSELAARVAEIEKSRKKKAHKKSRRRS